MALPSNTLAIYLTQYLKVASGSRVVLHQQGSMGSSIVGDVKSFFVFKCTVCQDNWHVGTENFTGSPWAVPEVLTDWVKKHRHVCNKYVNTHGVHVGTCSMCGWPYGAHSQSWEDVVMPDGQTLGNFAAKPTEGKTLGKVWVPADKWPAPPLEKPLPTFKGRKFRETE